MKIMLISRGYPSDKYKMNGIFEFDQAKSLVELGHEVVMVCLDMRSIFKPRKLLIESFIKDGVKIECINIPLGGFSRKLLNILSIYSLKYMIRRLSKKGWSPDIIHAHFLYNAFFLSHINNDEKIPFIMTEHLSYMNKQPLDAKLLEIGNNTYSKMSQVIVVGEELKRNIYNNFKVNAIVVPNIVNTETFLFEKREKKEKFTFVSAGRLIEHKKMVNIIEAFNIGFKGNKNVELKIFGDGPLKSDLESLIEKYKLKDQVKLMGLQSREVIATNFKESNVFVLASDLETFGVVCIEALAAGLPVIATHSGGPEDFINSSNGILISKNNIEELVKAMKEMLNNEKRYNHKSISKNIQVKFNSKEISLQIEKIYIKSLQGDI